MAKTGSIWSKSSLRKLFRLTSSTKEKVQLSLGRNWEIYLLWNLGLTLLSSIFHNIGSNSWPLPTGLRVGKGKRWNGVWHLLRSYSRTLSLIRKLRCLSAMIAVIWCFRALKKLASNLALEQPDFHRRKSQIKGTLSRKLILNFNMSQTKVNSFKSNIRGLIQTLDLKDLRFLLKIPVQDLSFLLKDQLWT